MMGIKKGEKGMMTVEAVLCLVPFILVILGIISFTNVFMVHSRIQHAIYESASELSAYTYLYQVSGWREGDTTLDADSKKLTDFLESFDESRAALGKLTGGDISEDTFNDAVDKVEDTVDKGVGFIKNPKEFAMNLIANLLAAGSDGIKNILLELFQELLVPKYLDYTFPDGKGQNADSYLKAMGVKDGMSGLHFNKSTLFTDSKRHLIDVVVEYDLEIYFLKLFFKNPTLHVVQRVTVPAWLDGDGGTYYAD